MLKHLKSIWDTTTKFPGKTSAAFSFAASGFFFAEGVRQGNPWITGAGAGIALADIILYKNAEKPHDASLIEPQDKGFKISDISDFQDHPYESTATLATAIAIGSKFVTGTDNDLTAFAIDAGFDTAALLTIMAFREKARDHVHSNWLDAALHRRPALNSAALEITGAASFVAWELAHGHDISTLMAASLALYTASSVSLARASKRARLPVMPPQIKSLPAPQDDRAISAVEL